VLALAGCSAVDREPDESRPLAPEPDCGDCYVVNAALAGAGATLFMGGYFGDGTASEGFVRAFESGAWSARLDGRSLGAVRSLWAASSHELYLIAGGNLQHLDLDVRQLDDVGIAGTVVWGSARDDVWVLGAVTAQRFDGDGWNEEPLPLADPIAVSGSSAADVFALGAEGTIVHYDGEAWTEVEPAPTPDLQDIVVVEGQLHVAAGADAGDNGTARGAILRYDGRSWHEEQRATGDALLAIAAAGASRMYAVGGSREPGGAARPIVWQFDGERWSRSRAGDTDAFLWDAFCDEAGTCYAAGTDNTFLELDF